MANTTSGTATFDKTFAIDEIIESLLLAFDNYFVKMSTERDYYINRWKVAKVDFQSTRNHAEI